MGVACFCPKTASAQANLGWTGSREPWSFHPTKGFHKHFNGRAQPALGPIAGITPYTEGADKSLQEGGSQIEYDVEDPAVLDEFEAEVIKNGARPDMRGFFPCRTQFKVEVPA